MRADRLRCARTDDHRDTRRQPPFPRGPRYQPWPRRRGRSRPRPRSPRGDGASSDLLALREVAAELGQPLCIPQVVADELLDQLVRNLRRAIETVRLQAEFIGNVLARDPLDVENLTIDDELRDRLHEAHQRHLRSKARVKEKDGGSACLRLRGRADPLWVAGSSAVFLDPDASRLGRDHGGSRSSCQRRTHDEVEERSLFTALLSRPRSRPCSGRVRPRADDPRARPVRARSCVGPPGPPACNASRTRGSACVLSYQVEFDCG